MKPGESLIVFFNTCASVAFYYKLFEEYYRQKGFGDSSLKFFRIHGEMKQQKRFQVYD